MNTDRGCCVIISSFEAELAEKLQGQGFQEPISKRLFHGTDTDTIEKIVNEGVDSRYRGENGGLYGFGAYFATHASTAHPFTTTVEHEEKAMFLCHVLTGRKCVGKPGLEVPPLLDRNIPEGQKYDCTVDNDDEPSEWVVFNIGYAYPMYLIRYSLV
jgi:hypothetical protein